MAVRRTVFSMMENAAHNSFMYYEIRTFVGTIFEDDMRRFTKPIIFSNPPSIDILSLFAWANVTQSTARVINNRRFILPADLGGSRARLTAMAVLEPQFTMSGALEVVLATEDGNVLGKQ